MSKAALALALVMAAPLGAMSPRPQPSEALRQRAGELWRQGEFEEAGALYQALAPRQEEAARDWLAFLLERQGAAAASAALSAMLGSTLTASLAGPQGGLWLARSLACQARWSDALGALERLSPSAEASALKAEALDFLGSTLAGRAYGEAALSKWPGRARILLKAGDWQARSGSAELAEKAYKDCEKEDPSYSQVHARLAALYQRQGRDQDAKTRLERALNVDSADEASREGLNGLLAARPELAAKAKAAQKSETRRFLAAANPEVAALASLEGEPLVRVGLLDLAPSFKMRLGGAMRVKGEGLPEDLSLSAGTALEAGLSGGHWELRALDAEAKAVSTVARFKGPLRLEPLELASTFGVFDVENGAGYFWAGREHRYYRGAAELRPAGAKGLTLVNELGMEAYLLSVVPSEIRADWPAEALKAQAIAARTDSLRKLGSEKAKGYDLCPTVACAVYRGVGAEDRRTSAAVLATAGQVLVDAQGRLAACFYMNNSGGHTQEPGEAWAKPSKGPAMAVYDGPEGSATAALFPVMPASLLELIDDPEGRVDGWAKRGGGPAWRWVRSYTLAELEGLVGRRHEVGSLLSVEPQQRTTGGYVRSVRFSGAKGSSLASSDRIRTAIKGLRSNLFYVETRRDLQGRPVEFIFRGAGWGHGVGMSQAGAAGMAEAGKKAGEILHHYYGAAKMRKRY